MRDRLAFNDPTAILENKLDEVQNKLEDKMKRNGDFFLFGLMVGGCVGVGIAAGFWFAVHFSWLDGDTNEGSSHLRVGASGEVTRVYRERVGVGGLSAVVGKVAEIVEDKVGVGRLEDCLRKVVVMVSEDFKLDQQGGGRGLESGKFALEKVFIVRELTCKGDEVVVEVVFEA